MKLVLLGYQLDVKPYSGIIGLVDAPDEKSWEIPLREYLRIPAEDKTTMVLEENSIILTTDKQISDMAIKISRFFYDNRCIKSSDHIEFIQQVRPSSPKLSQRISHADQMSDDEQKGAEGKRTHYQSLSDDENEKVNVANKSCVGAILPSAGFLEAPKHVVKPVSENKSTSNAKPVCVDPKDKEAKAEFHVERFDGDPVLVQQLFTAIIGDYRGANGGVKGLLEACPNLVFCRDATSGLTPLMYVAEYGPCSKRSELTGLILRAGFSIGSILSKKSLLSFDKEMAAEIESMQDQLVKQQEKELEQFRELQKKKKEQEQFALKQSFQAIHQQLLAQQTSGSRQPRKRGPVREEDFYSEEDVPKRLRVDPEATRIATPTPEQASVPANRHIRQLFPR